MCVLFPLNRTSGLFDKYCKVVLTGEPLSEEFSVPLEDGKEMWLRQRVRSSWAMAWPSPPATPPRLKANEERYRSLSNFSNSVFENAPFSIIETDPDGIIRR
jgi:hypothetical protein